MAVHKIDVLLLLAAAQLGSTSASNVRNSEKASLHARQLLPGSSNGDDAAYAPRIVTCPSTRPTIREAGSGLSEGEQDFLTKRRAATMQPMADLFGRAKIADFDAQAYLRKHQSDTSSLPNIAVAISGGGYRALMNGAGFLAAADNRTQGSTGPGGIGGLLQASTYVAGLSGGSWLLGSLYANGFSSVNDMMANGEVWQFQNSIFTGPMTGVLDTISYWNNIQTQVDDKASAGFETSITDYWARALAYQLLNARNGSPGLLWSSIAQSQDLANGNVPMPILVADGRDPGATIISLNATNYEISPWEAGTFDPTVYGFAPLQWLGSNFSAGIIPPSGICVNGFDSASYVMGTSSSLFNAFLTTNISTVADVPSFVADAFSSLQDALGEANEDIAQWAPNPFLGFNPASNPTTQATQLYLVDGGEDQQNIPLSPLIHPQRAVDVIFAVDSSADTPNNWPNGTALRASYDRSQAPISNGTLFPPVPDADTFVNLGLNDGPSFFGCDAANFTLRRGQSAPPLLVYLPNGPYTAFSNVTTFEPDYPLGQRDAFVANGASGATQGNASLDGDWPACVACAALSRSFGRTKTSVPTGCRNCFDKYCWNGTLDTRQASVFAPALKVVPGAGPAPGSSGGGSGTGSGGGKPKSGGVTFMAASDVLKKMLIGLCGAIIFCIM